MPEPVWKSPGWITAMVGLISIALTVPSVVGDYLGRQQDIQLAIEKTKSAEIGNLASKQELEFEIVLNTIAQQGLERIFVLRYLAATLDDQEARDWAASEASRLDTLANENKSLRITVKALQEKQVLLKMQSVGSNEANTLLQQEIGSLSEEINQQQAKITSLEEKAGIGGDSSMVKFFYIEPHINWNEIPTARTAKVYWDNGQVSGSGACYPDHRPGLCKFPVRGEVPASLTIEVLTEELTLIPLQSEVSVFAFHPLDRIAPYMVIEQKFGCSLLDNKTVCRKLPI